MQDYNAVCNQEQCDEAQLVVTRHTYIQAVLMAQNRKEPVVFTFTNCVLFRFEAVTS
jgi:predicted SnoaL-like aldol condensation-catalyzing enzyme